MNLTEEQKEIIKSSIEDFNMKFSKIKREFLNMGYKENDAEDLAYIVYVITQQGGLKDQVKVSKAVYMVDQIAKFSTQHNKYEDVGRFAMDILQECGVINFNK